MKSLRILLILLVAASGSATPVRRYGELFENYWIAATSNDTRVIRSYARNAYLTAINYEMERDDCPRTNGQSSMIDVIKRVVCMVKDNFTRNEQLALLLLSTIYALVLFLLAAGFVAVCCTPPCGPEFPEPPKKPTKLLLRVVKPPPQQTKTAPTPVFKIFNNRSSTPTVCHV